MFFNKEHTFGFFVKESENNMDKNITIHKNKLTATEFCELQESVGFGYPNIEQIETALRNSIYKVSVKVDNKIIGMGRLVGDGARIYYVQDVFINPQYQGQGIGTLIVEELLSYIKTNKPKEFSVMVGLMSAKGKEEFYERFGFITRPNDKQGSGMLMFI